MGEVMHNYSAWVRQRWELCCDEREHYGEKTLTLDDFLFEYKDYLRREYVIDKEKERNADI